MKESLIKNYLFLALIIASQAVMACHAKTTSERARECTLAVPANQAYTGAYIDFGDTEDNITIEAIEAFEALVGKHQAIVASSSNWGKNAFPRDNMEIISNYGAVPLLYWLPWESREDWDAKRIDRYSLRDVLAGKYDAYLTRWGDQARDYGRPLLVAWGIEMNGNWFPWSGVFYGGGALAAEGRFAGPELYKQAYRYVVDKVRSRGAKNIQWVLHLNSGTVPAEAWNNYKSYYPGAGYVDWLGLSAYGQQYPYGKWWSVDAVFIDSYREISALDPAKPILLAEWGVANFPESGSMSAWIAEFFRRIPGECPRIRGAVYWHELWQNGDDSWSTLRVNATDEALQEYRKGVAGSYWRDRPLWVEEKLAQ
ncbi:MAG: glycosyl hydrolase [Desulfatitalea sp.]